MTPKLGAKNSPRLCQSNPKGKQSTSAIPRRTIDKGLRMTRGEVGLKRWKLKDFELGKQLGRGTSGNVWLARTRKEKFVLAIKAVRKKGPSDSKFSKLLKQEVELQSSLRHPNILQLYGYFYDNDRFYMMIEWAPGGELYRHLHECGPFSAQKTASYVAQVASGLEYCHKRNIIHRDLKPENLLIGVDGRIKISDFGNSIQSCDPRRTFCGTQDYMSPEIIEHKAYSHCVDVWALGVITYELLTGSPPFYDLDLDKTHANVLKNPIQYPSYVEEDSREFVNSALEKDSSKRMTIADIRSHPWILKHTSK